MDIMDVRVGELYPNKIGVACWSAAERIICHPLGYKIESIAWPVPSPGGSCIVSRVCSLFIEFGTSIHVLIV